MRDFQGGSKAEAVGQTLVGQVTRALLAMGLQPFQDMGLFFLTPGLHAMLVVSDS